MCETYVLGVGSSPSNNSALRKNRMNQITLLTSHNNACSSDGSLILSLKMDENLICIIHKETPTLLLKPHAGCKILPVSDEAWVKMRKLANRKTQFITFGDSVYKDIIQKLPINNPDNSGHHSNCQAHFTAVCSFPESEILDNAQPSLSLRSQGSMLDTDSRGFFPKFLITFFLNISHLLRSKLCIRR